MAQENLANKRLQEEFRQHAARLAHERKEALVTTAADAFTKASYVLQIGPASAEWAERLANTDLADTWVNAVWEARAVLQVVMAVGWSDQVQEAAAVLIEAIIELDRAARRAADIVDGLDDPLVLADRIETLGQRYLTAGDALEEYRRAIAEADEFV